MASTTVDELIKSALQQPESERARIAKTLIASLDTTAERDVDQAWQQEIDMRLHEIDSGTVKCIPWEQVRDRLYRNAHVQR